MEQHADVGDEVSQTRVVCAVEDDIVVCDCCECVLGGERVVVRDVGYVWVYFAEGGDGGKNLWEADPGCGVEGLAVEVGELDGVVVYYPECADSGGGEVGGGWAAESAGADDEYFGEFEECLA